MNDKTFLSVFDIFANGKEAVDPAQLRALREELFQLAHGIRQQLDGGLPPSDVPAARSLLLAAEAAETVVEALAA
jgi:hypothetical protein